MISSIIDFFTLTVASATLFYFLRERKRGLSEAVYQKQVDASYEIMLSFTDLEYNLTMWGHQRNARGVYSIDYKIAVENEYDNLLYIFRKYNLILPNELISSIQKLIESFQWQIKEMNENPKADSNWELLSFGFYELQGKMRDFFGVEKLSESNKVVIEHFDKVDH